MQFIKDVTKYFTFTTASTLGIFTAIVIWESGLGEIVKEQAVKLFDKD